jgi:hypothetical protein
MKSQFPEEYVVYERDARGLSFTVSESVHPVRTSSPYANLLEYSDKAGKDGNIAYYEMLLNELDQIVSVVDQMSTSLGP